jgi:hypothetical protein
LERVHRIINKAELNYVPQLIELHECVSSTCGNNSMPCVKVGEEYIKLTHEHVRAWSKVITKKRAILNKPHDRLRVRIKEQAAEQAKAREAKNAPKKKKKQRKSESETEGLSDLTRKRRRRRGRGLDYFPYY